MKEVKENKFSAKFVNLKLTVHPHAWRPPTDLFEMEKEFIIRIEIAGMSEKDFTVNIDKSTITVFGKRSLMNHKCAYHRMEIQYGDFRTIIELPGIVDSEGASAEYDNGFLTILLPKALPKNVKINQIGEQD